jgi:superfamily II DNA/RNA helicase
VTTTFHDLGVPGAMVHALAREGIRTPFPIQAATIPDALAGRDLCGRAPTGSGKTIAFGVPLLARVDAAAAKHPTGLVLVPTRELAQQVRQALIPLGRAAWRYILATYGGSAFAPQIDSLRKGASVVVATPGRLLDLVERGHAHLDAVQVLVIDEADRLADLGFLPHVRKIVEMTPRSRQTLLFSATLDGEVDELVRDHQRDPVRHDAGADDSVAGGATRLEHRFVVTGKLQRLGVAVRLVRDVGPTIVFTRTRAGAEKLAGQLSASGVRAEAIHGDRSQAQRDQALAALRAGRVQALVATDVAARGIHVDGLAQVLHWDVPDQAKDYVHRSGRTARAGAAGVAVTLVTPERQRAARRLIDELGLDARLEHPRPEQPNQARGRRRR